MLVFHELAPSPNSTKVRMALRYKDIPFRAVPVVPRDRSDLIELSGQELAPVIEDRGIVLNDSEAILQFLDANYRDTPRLFPSEREGRKACDAWKRKLDEAAFPVWGPIFFHALGFVEKLDPAARDGFVELLAGFDRELEQPDPFGGQARPVDDLRVAMWATFALPGPALLERAPFFAKTRELFGVEPGRFSRLERFLAPWNERLG